MFVPTVGFREYVSFSGTAADIAFRVAIARRDLDEEEIGLVAEAGTAVTYCGKRGGFLQYERAETQTGVQEVSDLSPAVGFTLPLSQVPTVGAPIGTIQPLDELAASAEWDRVSTFGLKSVRVAHLSPHQATSAKKVDRAYVPSAVPYRLVKTTRAFAAYRRIDLTM